MTINDGSLDNSGNLYAVSGLNTITAVLANAGTIEVQAGTLDLAGGITGAGEVIVDEGATLEFSGATGSIHIVNSGSIMGAGSDAAIHIQQDTAGSVIDNDGTIGPALASSVTSTTEAIVETGGSVTINNTGDINGNISVAAGTFNNEAGGTWTVAGTSVFGDASSIVNHGAIDLHGASISGTGLNVENDSHIDSWGAASIAGDITNTDTGSIEVHTGILTLFGSLTGSASGAVVVDAGATLEVKDTVSQTITLAGDGSELEVDTKDFGGSIADLTANDKIDLTMIKWGPGTSAVYVPDADHPASGGVLTVTGDDGKAISLKLVGDYRDAHFAGSDEGGHTLITIHANDDAPTFTDETSPTAVVAEQTGVTGASTLDHSTPAGGTIHFTDVDLTDRPTAEITDQSATWLDSDGHTQLTLTSGQASALENALAVLTSGKNNGAVDWSYSIQDSALDFLGQGQTATVVSTITLDDHHGGTDTAHVTVTITGANDAPVINVDQVSVTQDSDEHVIVHGLSVTDADAAADETFTLAASTADSGSNVSPSSGSGSLDTINSALQTVTYNEGSGEPSTDKVALTVTDGHGATDTVNLIFNLAENSEVPASLSGTTGKDVFFGTGYQEQFVFSANSNHDTIVNFTPGQDQIDLTAVVTTGSVSDWMAQHVAASPTNSADSLITIDSADTILLKGVKASSLHAGDFIVHS